jgi:crossover junction endodeoxyribonuclease RuvC
MVKNKLNNSLTNNNNNNKERIIIGIDPGVQHIGIAILDIFYPKEVITVEYSLEKKKSAYFLLYMFFLEDIIQIYKPDVIAIEKPFFTPKTLANNIRTLEVIGIIKSAAQTPEYIIPTCEFTPSTIKKKVTGNGKAKKDEIINKIKKLYANKSFLSSHTADAISVALTYYANKESLSIDKLFDLNKID